MLETRPRTENWTLSINLNQRNPQRGCYLALTFGTLLSSQGADALVLRPFQPSFEAVSPLYTVLRSSPTSGSDRRFPRLAARSVLARCRSNSTPPPAPSAGGSAEGGRPSRARLCAW